MPISQQFQQLPMFMSAREIHAQYAPASGDFRGVDMPGGRMRLETADELRSRKLKEAETTPVTGPNPLGHTMFADKVTHEGMTEPVRLGWSVRGTPMMRDSQHRVAVLAKNRPNLLLPVEHAGPARRRPPRPSIPLALDVIPNPPSRPEPGRSL